jgi:HPt (histidine-containing phosphotransfer) domain-containing protein
MSASLINLDYLKIMTDNDSAMQKVMIQMILEELPIELVKLDQHINDADWEKAHEVSHKLKSTLSFVGSSIMSELNTKIMISAKNKEELHALPDVCMQLKDYSVQVINELTIAKDKL